MIGRNTWSVLLLSLGLLGTLSEPSAADPFEPNDTFETAYGPLSPMEDISCTIDSLADLDWFYFDADEGEYLIRLSSIPDGRDYDLFMSFDGESIFASSQNGPEFREEVIEGVFTAPGRVWIWVESVLGADLDDPYLLNANFVPIVDSPPQVEILAPNGGEVWPAGSTQTILWTAIDEEDSTSLSITVESSLDDGSTWKTLAMGIPNLGSLSWSVPAAPTSLGRIRVTATDLAAQSASDLSDSPFTISSVLPTGQATLTAQSLTAGSGDPVAITLSLEHDQSLISVAGTVAIDSTLFSISDVIQGSRYADFTLSWETLGGGMISFQLDGATLSDGSGPLLSVHGVTTEGPGGTSDIELTATVLDMESRPMNTTLVDGELTVNPQVIPELTLSLPDSVEAGPAAAFAMPVTFSSNVSVRNLSFALEYDHRQMSVTSVTAGDRIAGWSMIADTSVGGRIEVVITPIGVDSILAAGVGTVCTLEFLRAEDPIGNPSVVFVGATATDANGSQTVTTRNGAVTALGVTGFAAATTPEGVRLRWQAETTQAISGFRVHRAELTDPVSLTPDRLDPQARSFLDRDVQPGRAYRYWLEVLGRDGTTERLGPVTLEVPSGIRVGLPYPNPFRAEVRLALPPGSRDLETTVLDIQGRVIAVPLAGQGEVVWDGRSDDGQPVPAGIYFLRLQHAEGHVIRRVVKTRD